MVLINGLSGEKVFLDYDDLYNFHNGYALLEKDNKYSFINKELINDSGKEFESIEKAKEFKEDYPYELYNLGEDTSLSELNTLNDIEDREAEKNIKKSQFDYIGSYVNDLAAAEQNGKNGYIDKEGNIIIAFEYERCEAFKKFAVAKVTKNGEDFYIDTKGNPIFIPSIDFLEYLNKLAEEKELQIDKTLLEKLSQLTREEKRYFLEELDNDDLVWLVFAINQIGKRDKELKKYVKIIDLIVELYSDRLSSYIMERIESFERVEFILFEEKIKEKISGILDRDILKILENEKIKSNIEEVEEKLEDFNGDSFPRQVQESSQDKFKRINEAKCENKYIKYSKMFEFFRELILQEGVLAIEEYLEDIEDKELVQLLELYIDGDEYPSKYQIVKENQKIYLWTLHRDIIMRYSMLKILMLSIEYESSLKFRDLLRGLFGEKFDYEKEVEDTIKSIFNYEIIWELGTSIEEFKREDLENILKELFKDKKLEELTIKETLLFIVLYTKTYFFIMEYRPTMFQESKAKMLDYFYRLIDENIKTDKLWWYIDDLKKTSLSIKKLERVMCEEVAESKKLYFWAMRRMKNLF